MNKARSGVALALTCLLALAAACGGDPAVEVTVAGGPTDGFPRQVGGTLIPAAPQRIVGNWRLAMPHWLSDDVLLLVLREDRPWLVAATVDGQLTVVGRIDPGADAGARAIVAVVPVPAD